MTEPPLVEAVLPRARRADRGRRCARRGRSASPSRSTTLRITAVCPCDQPYCGSFHTLQAADQALVHPRSPGRRCADDEPGEISVDVVRGEIAYVEVLYLDGVRETLARLPPE